MNVDALKRIFTINLGVKKDEKVLIFTDIVNADEHLSVDAKQKRERTSALALDAAEAGREYCNTVYAEFPSRMGHGKEPPIELWKAAFGANAVNRLIEAGMMDRILKKQADKALLKAAERIIKEAGVSPHAIIALSHFSTSHTRFRDFLTNIMGARYASMPLFEEDMLDGAMSADWNEVQDRTNRVAAMLAKGEEVYITTHNGTAINFSIAGRRAIADTGIITGPGSFSNLPAGEAFLAPVEGTANGTLIVEWAPDRKLSRPVELYVKDGSVVDVAGKGEFADKLRGLIDSNPLIGNIAELGIGTNDKATRPNNILETEKILGTLHIAIGDNSSFGGKVSVPFHEDFIFFRPTLEVIKGEDKVEVIVDGEPRF
ncbi:MAG: aminopeptidase [Deltaproteobacteria bacterium]|nr:aminopeptidase [Deltaproteobacteria bacterium]